MSATPAKDAAEAMRRLKAKFGDPLPDSIDVLGWDDETRMFYGFPPANPRTVEAMPWSAA